MFYSFRSIVHCELHFVQSIDRSLLFLETEEDTHTEESTVFMDWNT